MNESQLTTRLEAWKGATHALPWGVQALCLDTLKLAANEKVSLVHGIDVKDGTPCLFNAISNLTTQGSESPCYYAPEVVTLFDLINKDLQFLGVNTEPYKVSPLAAEVLVHHFGQLKTPTEDDKARVELERLSFIHNCAPYFEPTDEELISDWLLAIESNDATSERPSNQRQA